MKGLPRAVTASTADPVVTVKDLVKGFHTHTDIRTLLTRGAPKTHPAVDGVSFDIGQGETFGLVGESGSGKTTIGRLLLRLEPPDGGAIIFRELSTASGGARSFYRHVQMIFQDPYASLNPRFKVLDTVMDPVKVQRLVPRGARIEAVSWALERAGLAPAGEYLGKYPHQLSGGQRQRVAIARALVMRPRMLVADEPVSMLDVSIKAGILNVLKSLSDEDGVAVMYISHDLSTVKYLCRRTAIMYRGRFVELGPSEEVISHPRHPYAQALKAAIPNPDPNASRVRVSVTDALQPEELYQGCRFRHQCPEAFDICAEEDPQMREVEPGHFVACHLYDAIP